MKDIQSSEINSAKQENPFDHRSYFGHDFSLNDIQAIFDANGLDVGVDFQPITPSHYPES
jgi:hypothetical protein